MSVSTPFKGVLAGLAAVALAAIAQSTPPSTSKDPATGAGQQSTQSTPMGDTGTSKTPDAGTNASSTPPSSSGSTMGASGGSTTTTTTDTTTTDTNVASQKTRGMRTDRN